MGINLNDVMTDHVDSVFTNVNHFGVAITYKRGTLSVTFNAIVSQSVFETAGDYSVTRLETRDYSFKPASLVLNSITVTPERGDKIIEGNRTHIVTDPAGQPAYQYDDENRLMMRVHTVLAKDA